MERVAAEEGLDEDPLPGGLIVAHFRIDPGKLVFEALGWGALVIVVGSILVGAGLLWSRATPHPLDAVPARSGVLVGQRVDAEGRPIPTRGDNAMELSLVFVGLGVIVLGGGVVLLGLRRELLRESYLVFRTDGALFRDGTACSGVLWEDVEAVRWDEARSALCFVFHDGEEWVRAERFAGAAGPELARRGSEVRRKALFGLYG